MKERYRLSQTFGEVISLYLKSPKFEGLAPATKESYSRYLTVCFKVLGHLPVAMVGPPEVQELLDALESERKLGAAQRIKVVLGAVERFAIVRRLIPSPITIGTHVEKSKDGHKPWTDEQVRCGVRFSRPNIGRIILLAANTGQRGSDLCCMRWSDLEGINGVLGIHVAQRKTGLRLWVPCTQELTNAIQTWERRPGFILTKPDGQPYKNRHSLSAAWERERDRNPNLAACAGLVLHGLRATAVIRLRRAGATTPQIVDMVGLSAPMVERYSRFADQKQSALAAVHKLDFGNVNRTGTEQGKTIRKSVSETPKS